MNRFSAVTAMALAASACPGATEPPGPLALGTWGGDNVGVIVSDTTMHVHIGCTVGDAPRPSLTDGRFEVAGLYNITAHPVDLGIFHPAMFVGQQSGDILIITVTLTDTSVTLGPALVRLGHEPHMGPCPICRPAAARRRHLPRQASRLHGPAPAAEK